MADNLTPKISIIIPVYNSEKFLCRCLDSIINQSLKELEIICIDDGSEDNSAQILMDYAAKDERIIAVKQDNLGVSTTRNNGIDMAKGTFVSFVDSDDFIDKEFFKTLYDAAIETNSDIACAGIIREKNKKKNVLLKFDKKRFFNETREKFINTNTPRHSYVWNKIYKREALIKANIKFPAGKFYEDIIFTTKVMSELGQVVVVPKIYYHYWVHKSSIIKNSSDKHRADKLFASKISNEYCEKFNLNPKENWHVDYKEEIHFLGIPVIKIYHYKATKKFYLFNIIPFLTIYKKI